MEPLFGVIAYINILIRNICYKITFFSRQIHRYPFKIPYAYSTGIILLLCFFPFQLALGQTSIVAIRLNDQVVVGADSKIHLEEATGLKIPVSEPICKIGKGDGFFFATSGLLAVKETGYNANKIISEAPKINGTIEQKIERLEEMIKTPLTESLERHRRVYPWNYPYTSGTKPALEIVFLAVEKDSPFLLRRDFIPITSAFDSVEMNIVRKKCPGDCQNGEDIYPLGEKRAIKERLSQGPNFWKNDPINAIRKLIELEIADDPFYVGPPIDILQIDKNGARWIEKKKECPDIQ